MIAVDTNILVYAHREDSPHHAAALDALRSLVEAGRPWGVPWPCVHEFLAIATHRRIYDPPTSAEVASRAATDLLALEGCRPLAETADHLLILTGLVTRARLAGPAVHDARVAAICLGHGTDELLTADRDFGAFPALRTRNPLV